MCNGLGSKKEVGKIHGKNHIIYACNYSNVGGTFYDS
jgi:hypothetical protein